MNFNHLDAYLRWFNAINIQHLISINFVVWKFYMIPLGRPQFRTFNSQCTIWAWNVWAWIFFGAAWFRMLVFALSGVLDTLVWIICICFPSESENNDYFIGLELSSVKRRSLHTYVLDVCLWDVKVPKVHVGIDFFFWNQHLGTLCMSVFYDVCVLRS